MHPRPSRTPLGDRLQTFLQARGLTRPDHRPLYEYRASEAELEEIRGALDVELREAIVARRAAPWVAQGFCLWAAEWWRTHHEQGPWRWADVLHAAGCEELGTGGPGYPFLCELVSRGISAWGREVLRVGPAREFLLTLACEGGLPLRMVQREQGSLGRYLRALLEEMRVFGARAAPAELAERVGGYLPRGLRNDVVFRLSGNLVHAIRNLQEKIGDTRTPTLDLDREDPGWRDRLPLRLDDATAAGLLDTLLRDAVRVACGRRTEVRWHRGLRRDGDRWVLFGEPEVPGGMDPEHVAALFEIPEAAMVPERFDLLLRTDAGQTSLLALATSVTTRDGRGEMRLEHAPGARTSAVGAAVVVGRSLIARDGRHTRIAPVFAGAGALEPDLTWVFTPEDENASRLALAGQGSVSTRASCAWVAVPEGCVPADGAESCADGGVLDEPPRRVFRVSGTVSFVDPRGARQVVRTGAATPLDGREYWLEGRRAELGRDGEAVFWGMPRLRLRLGDGPSLHLPDREVAWIADGPSRTGPPLRLGEPGAGRLRHIADGEVRYSTRIQVLPAGGSLRYLPDPQAGSGVIEFSLCGAPAVTATVPPTVRWSAGTGDGDLVRLRLESPGNPPASVDIGLGWAGGGRMRLTLPFPARGCGFMLPEGERLMPDAVVAEGRLAGIRAVALVPRAGAAFYVEGTVRGADAADLPPGRRLFRMEMPELRQGQFKLDLGFLQGEVSRRLHLGGADAEVRLRIQSNDAGFDSSPALVVRRFDLRLQHLPGSSVLRIPPEQLGALPPDEIKDLHLRAVPLYSPEGPETILPAAADSAAWEVPDDLSGEGPWLILGEHGEWLRVAPFAWPAHVGDERTGSGTPYGRLPTGSPSWAEHLASDAGASGWEGVDALVRWTSTVPPAVLAPLRHLAESPDACALAAVRAGESYLPRVWQAVEALGAWWHLVPRRSWDKASAAYWASLMDGRETLSAAFGAEVAQRMLMETFDGHVQLVAARLPGLLPVFARARGRLTGTPLSRDATSLMRDGIRAQLIERRNAALEHCPVLEVSPRDRIEIPGISALRNAFASLVPEAVELWVDRVIFAPPERHGFVNAPVVAALSAVTNHPLSAAQRRAVREVHDLRPLWFDDLYECTYLLALGSLFLASASRALSA